MMDQSGRSSPSEEAVTRGFVVGMFIETAGYMPVDARHALESPAFFGVKRGYWQVALRKDEIGNDRPDGIDVTIELSANSTEQAEDTALIAGQTLSTLFSAYLGSPLTVAHLSRLAEVGKCGGILEQRTYAYLDRVASWGRVKIDSIDFNSLVRRIASQSPKRREALELAIRWYGICLAAEDPIDKFLASWIGLEALGPLLDYRFHPKGPKAPCTICQNKAGINRDRKRAGLSHLFGLVVPKMLEERTFQDVEGIRDDIAHAARVTGELRRIGEVREEASVLVEDLSACLTRGLLTLVSPGGAKAGLLNSALPRNYTIQPDSMVSIISDVELVQHRPWLGEWIDVNNQREEMFSRIDDSGEYISGYYPRITYQASHAGVEPNLTWDYVMFDRRSYEIEFKNDAPIPEVRQWRDRAVSPAWQRVIGVDHQC